MPPSGLLSNPDRGTMHSGGGGEVQPEVICNTSRAT